MIRTLIAAALLGCAPAALAQGSHAGHNAAPVAESASDPAGERVGTEFMVFDTGVEGAAHQHFLRGLALLHNFEYDRAAAAFRESQQADPDWVMSYWGEAMTHNHPLWEQQELAAARAILARLGPNPQARAAKARTPREAAWLGAVETLYGEGGTKEARDHLYLAKMRALHAADPADIDARAFTGLAILGTSHGGRDIALYMEAAGVLEPGFMTHEQHPGILHYLIHSYDDPIHAPLGERMAARYANVAPDAGHAQHMISHIYHALGDWEASERANVLADAVVDRQRASSGLAPNSCGHYNEWLVYARLQLGKDASDIVSGCRSQAEAHIARGAANRLGFGAASSYAAIAAWQGVDTGVWPDRIDEGTGEGFLLARMMLAHARALQYRDDPQTVETALGELQAVADAFALVLPQVAPDDRTSVAWAQRAVAQVDAIRMIAAGERDAGLIALRAAAEAESALPVVFGPPNIAKPSWEVLGEELLALGRQQEAAEAFRRSLQFAPNRKLSNAGLAAATGG
ncbi:MAG: hypothetical protein V2I27_13100 [Erythrobacter sp.]|jgi:tetratricopeptide (TPR) repeat protein|nr:hypothetical protein [Erythrobacter sp.]